MNLLRIVINGEESPKYCISNAFIKHFELVDTIWWESYQNALHHLNDLVKSHLQSEKYDVVFMQIQKDGIIYPETLSPYKDKVLIFNWTGDVRENIDNYLSLKNEVITLFSNTTDVEKMIKEGGRADFLQTGYDWNYYYNVNNHRLNYLTFIGNHYNNHNFHNKDFRSELIKELYSTFPENIRVYGSGWNYLNKGIRPTNDKIEEWSIYNSSLVALNIPHFSYGNYYSDRLLRAMACGCCVLSLKYEGYEKEFTDGKNIVIWETVDELKDKFDYYIRNRDEALEIGRNAANYVLENCNWEKRVQEFISLIKKHKNYEFNALSR